MLATDMKEHFKLMGSFSLIVHKTRLAYFKCGHPTKALSLLLAWGL